MAVMILGAYTIEAQQGLGNQGFSDAQLLAFDADTPGAVTPESEIYLEPYQSTVYGVMYRFEAAAQDWIEVDLTSQAAAEGTPLGLVLFDANQAMLASGYMNPVGPDLQYSLPQSGQYYLMVGFMDESIPGQSLSFDIRLSRGEPPQPGGGPIAYGETLDGFVINSEGDAWTFQAEAGDEATITMRSSSIDSTLTLLAPDGTQLAYDDDGAGYPNAMIFAYRIPTSGTYTILARSLGASLGAYSLSLELSVPGDTGQIGRGETVDGTLDPGTRDRWTFQGEAGEQVSIVMTSDVFDTYLELYGPDSQMLTYNDDAGSTRRSEISDFVLPATGSYLIVARGYSGSVGGAYTLELR